MPSHPMPPATLSQPSRSQSPGHRPAGPLAGNQPSPPEATQHRPEPLATLQALASTSQDERLATGQSDAFGPPPSVIADAIAELADSIHACWITEYKRQNGASAQRWKPLSNADYDAMRREADEQARRGGTDEWFTSNVRGNGGERQIDIAGLSNRQLPAKFAAENIAAADGAIGIIRADPEQDVEYYAGIVHEQWLARNGSWAPPGQKVPYDRLADGDKEKDRVIVRAALQVLDRAGAR